MDFVTIDFETANARRESACEVGITIVENGKIQDTLSWLIRPKIMEFHWMNMKIHGITEDDVGELKTIIGDKMLIAHNASFDMSVLRAAMNAYEIQVPKIEYACTMIASKRTWTGLENYRLDTLCQLNAIDNRQHHRAANDANVTAQLALKILHAHNANSFGDLNKVGVFLSSLERSGWNRYTNEIKGLVNENSVPSWVIDALKNEAIADTFKDKNVLFTGALLSMERKYAHWIVEKLGGVSQTGINKKTNVLVVGLEDYWSFKQGYPLTSKIKKALQYKESGIDIEIISENDFLDILNT